MKYFLFFDQATKEVLLFELKNMAEEDLYNNLVYQRNNYRFIHKTTLDLGSSPMLSMNREFMYRENKINL